MNTQQDEALEAALLASLNVPPAIKSKVKVISIGGIKTKETAKTQTEYPMLPDPTGQHAMTAAAFLKAAEDEVEAKTRKEMHSGALKAAVRPFYFKVAHGLPEPPSCIAITGPTGQMLIQCKEAYKKVTDPDVIEKVIGADLTAAYFRQKLSVEIQFDAVPADKQELLAEKLVALAKELGISDSDALKQESVFKPTPEFFTARHRVMTEAQNMALEQAFGSSGFMTLAASTGKGRK